MIGRLCALTYNLNRGKGRRALRAKDFLPRWPAHAKEAADPAVLQHRLMAFAQAHNATVASARNPG